MSSTTLASVLELAKVRELADRGEQNRHDQHNDSGDRAEVPRDPQLRKFASRGIQMSIVSQLFPMSADDVCGLTGIRRDQVAGPHCAGQITRLWQVRSILAHRREDRVSAGGGSRPRCDRAVSRFEGERVFGVDAADLGPRDVGRAQNIAKRNAGCGHENGGAPEHGPRQKRNKTEDGQHLQGIQPASLKSRDDERGRARSKYDDGKYAPESRVQGEVWRHGTMFPRVHRIQGERRIS